MYTNEIKYRFIIWFSVMWNFKIDWVVVNTKLIFFSYCNLLYLHPPSMTLILIAEFRVKRNALFVTRCSEAVLDSMYHYALCASSCANKAHLLDWTKNGVECLSNRIV